VSDDLVQFLRARLDEDESTARAADGDKIEATPLYEGVAYLTLRGDHKDRYTGELPATLADHAARHDPARVLAEVDGKRQILRALESAEVALRNTEPGKEPCELMTGATNSLRAVARMLAAAYADHPDYRDEWRP
jgi:hypothetical protein